MSPSPEEFEEKWKGHFGEISRLRLATNDPENFHRLGELKDELDEIVEEVADEHRVE